MKVRGSKINNIKSKNHKTVIGTVHKDNPKCIYLKNTSWLLPVDEYIDNYPINKLNKEIKGWLHHNINKYGFSDRLYIVDLDIRESGLKSGKPSYCDCEITVYQKEVLPFNSTVLQKKLTQLNSDFIEHCLDNSKYFKFYQNKTDIINEKKDSQ